MLRPVSFVAIRSWTCLWTRSWAPDRSRTTWGIALLICGIVFFGTSGSRTLAEVRSEKVTYRDGDTELEGFLVWDDARQGKRPGVLVVHEWWGLNDYARKRATMLAEMGYVAFALDMYGKGKVTDHPQTAGQWASEIRQNEEAWRRRAVAGLEILRDHELVDTERMAAIGYCFGGSTVLQLAYANAGLKGVVSFHGALPLPSESTENIAARILICHGSADPFVPQEQIAKVQAALNELQADWQMIYYGDAKHSFTVPAAGEHNVEGLEYNEKADQRSWRSMQRMFEELFAGRN